MTRIIRSTYVLTTLLVALSMGLEFAHTLEMGAKKQYPPELFIRLHTSLYRWFGPPLGAVLWVGGIVVTGLLAWLLRVRSGRLLTGAACGLQLAALANYFARVEPVNIQFRAVGGKPPPDFDALRAQWDYGHVTGFVLFAAAFVLVVVAGSARTEPALVRMSAPSPTNER